MRKALLAIPDWRFSLNQIERVLHIIYDRNKGKLINIELATKILKNYNFVQTSANEISITIDEDLFVFIVSKFDGLSRLVNLINNLYNTTSYSSRHSFEFNLWGLSLLSNQRILKRLIWKAHALCSTFDSSLKMIAKQSIQMI